MRKIWNRLFRTGEVPEEMRPIPRITVDLSPEQRGTYARQLQGNPLLDEIFANLRADAFTVWSKTAVTDTEGREYLFKHFQVIDLVRRRISAYISDAALAEHSMTHNLKMPQPNRDGK